MKRIIAIILSFVFMFSFVACGEANTENTTTASTTSLETTTVEIPTGKTLFFKSVKTGDVIETDFAQITIGEVRTSNSIKDGNNILDRQNNNNMFIILNIEVTNLQNMSCSVGIFAEAIADNDLFYDAFVLNMNKMTLSPRETQTFHIAAEIPKDVLNSYSQFCFRFGMNDDFVFEQNQSLEDCKYLYEYVK